MLQDDGFSLLWKRNSYHFVMQFDPKIKKPKSETDLCRE